jgi:hypothetical protein
LRVYPTIHKGTPGTRKSHIELPEAGHARLHQC